MACMPGAGPLVAGAERAGGEARLVRATRRRADGRRDLDVFVRGIEHDNTAVGDTAADVIVVGAGPAGATAARTMAAAGIRALVLDRARFPRHKPCGGAISMRALSRFPWLSAPLARIATHWISRMHLEGPDRDAVALRSETPAALMIRRLEFDALLVSLAREAGADLV